MRWDIIKKTWKLARDQFKDIKRLYVELPAHFELSGQCSVFDLDKEAPIASIKYQTVNENGAPTIKLSLGEDKTQVPLNKRAEIKVSVNTKTSELMPKTSIFAKHIIDKYKDQKVLSEQVACLIAGHEEGIPGNELEEVDIDNWVLDYGFPSQILADTKEELGKLGIVIARGKKKYWFEINERVRVVDPNLRDHNEAAFVKDRKTTKDDEDNVIVLYLVIIDGSSSPVWVQQQQLAKLMAGFNYAG